MGTGMDIIDLTEENEDLYFVCLEDWSDEMKEAGSHKRDWYLKMKDGGLRVKLARDENGSIGGMIQYLPVEHSWIEGKDLYFIMCIWVHGYKKGRGDFRKRGMGRALLKAAEEDARKLGAKGIAAWGISMPFWMRASFFKKHGFRKVDKEKGMVLLVKGFSDGVEDPKWIRPRKKPGMTPGKVNVTAFLNGWCPAGNMVVERARRASRELGDRVEFNIIDTMDRKNLEEWGIPGGLFIDGKEVTTGPPLSYDKIYKMIEKRIKKIGKI
ncbi:MAG: GNAT family N-acetyltransferase [Candidatus Thermoplasmatota archaeon]|nr:GNAT family N-acetyltransferase [Candidatus Thermoplasmatota archaeon]